MIWEEVVVQLVEVTERNCGRSSFWIHKVVSQIREEVCEHQPCQRNMSMQPYVALVNVVVVGGGGGGVDLCCSLVVAIMPWSKLWEKILFRSFCTCGIVVVGCEKVKYMQYASDQILWL
jgi:hypothetical protein